MLNNGSAGIFDETDQLFRCQRSDPFRILPDRRQSRYDPPGKHDAVIPRHRDVLGNPESALLNGADPAETGEIIRKEDAGWRIVQVQKLQRSVMRRFCVPVISLPG